MIWTPRPTDDASRFSLTATQQTCVGPEDQQFVMGGVAMAAAIEAAEAVTEKPLLWATIQFISGSRLGDEIDIEVDVLGGGRSILQVGVRLTIGDRLLHHMSAALGGRRAQPLEQFPQMPDVPPPEDCDIKWGDVPVVPGNLIDHMERRSAFDHPDTGYEGSWIRMREDMQVSAPLLAITSDFLLGTHPKSLRGTSLDNTIRVLELRPTEWVLVVTRMGGFKNGVAHGQQYQFAQDGTLIALSSQTGLLPRES